MKKLSFRVAVSSRNGGETKLQITEQTNFGQGYRFNGNRYMTRLPYSQRVLLAVEGSPELFRGGLCVRGRCDAQDNAVTSVSGLRGWGGRLARRGEQNLVLRPRGCRREPGRVLGEETMTSLSISVFGGDEPNTFKITSQTGIRRGAFDFKSNRGFEVVSSGCPELRESCLFLQGGSKSGDDTVALIPSNLARDRIRLINRALSAARAAVGQLNVTWNK